MTLTLSRRSLLAAMPVVIAAPAIVRASSLMPVRLWKPETYWRLGHGRIWRLSALVERNNAMIEELRIRSLLRTSQGWRRFPLEISVQMN